MSVYGTVSEVTPREVFLGSVDSASLRGLRPYSSLLGVSDRPFIPRRSPYRLEPADPAAGWPILLRHPSVRCHPRWYGNINPFPIAYAFRPRLRIRLTLSGLPLLRKPWVCGERVSHPLYRYSCLHNHFHAVHPSLQSSFSPHGTLPYRSRPEEHEPAASVACLSPVTFSAQAR